MAKLRTPNPLLAPLWVVIAVCTCMGARSAATEPSSEVSNANKTLATPWRPEETLAHGHPVLSNETPLALNKLAWPTAGSTLLKASWATNDVFAKTPREILLSEDLQHIAFVQQPGPGQFFVTIDGKEGPGCDRIVGEIHLSADFSRAFYLAVIRGKSVAVHHGANGPKVYPVEDTAGDFPRLTKVRITDDLEHVTAVRETASHDMDFEVDGTKVADGYRHEYVGGRLITKLDPEQIGAPDGLLLDGKPLPASAQRLVVSEDGKHCMYVLQTLAGAENETQVWFDQTCLSTHAAGAQDIARPHFSPDGNHIAYIAFTPGSATAAASLYLDGRELARRPTGTFERILFDARSENIGCVYDPGSGGKVTVMVNGYEGPFEDRGTIYQLALGRDGCNVAYTTPVKLVVNGHSVEVEKSDLHQLMFTAKSAHVIARGASGRVGVMADGSLVPVNADLLWALQATAPDRFVVYGCRGTYTRGIPSEFVKFEFQIVDR